MNYLIAGAIEGEHLRADIYAESVVFVSQELRPTKVNSNYIERNFFTLTKQQLLDLVQIQSTLSQSVDPNQ